MASATLADRGSPMASGRQVVAFPPYRSPRGREQASPVAGPESSSLKGPKATPGEGSGEASRSWHGWSFWESLRCGPSVEFQQGYVKFHKYLRSWNDTARTKCRENAASLHGAN